MPVNEFLDRPPPQPEEGIGLALSGGGYRAMVFHVGALIRLNEAGVLGKIARVSSVSGGSITAGVLATSWKDLNFQNGIATKLDVAVDHVRKMADTSVDAGAIIGGILLPGSISDRVAKAYDDVLFDGATLDALPDDSIPGNPRFVINATTVQTAALWRFSRNYMGDYHLGLVERPNILLAAAVAASSAFPPVLSPMTLAIDQPVMNTQGADLHREPFTTTAVLSDGGVYDNLGLETITKRYTTLLVSDAGQKIAPEEDPHPDWARHSLRVLEIIDNQVRSLRKRYLVDSYLRGEHSGTYWGIRTAFADFKLTSDPLGCATRNPALLAEIPTRLERMPRDVQDRLMNWGYAICDAALRAHIDAALQAKLGITIQEPKGFPFAGGY
jgi:NTE family protein